MFAAILGAFLFLFWTVASVAIPAFADSTLTGGLT